MSVITPVRNLIDGEWSGSGSVRESVDPSDGEVVGTYVSAGRAEAEAAVAAARTAFDTTGWSRDPALRSRALSELADRIAERVPALSRTLTRENGKRLEETAWEAAISVDWLRYSAASALTQVAGRAAEPVPGQYFHSSPEAMGVAGIISPWNSPLCLTVRALGPAIGAGCTAVVKLPGQTALTNALFSEAVAATESLPPGVVNVLTEAGNEVAPLLVESPDVDVLSYTGSTHVGRLIAAAAAPTLKRLNLELGGKAPLIVFDDADLDAVVPQLVLALTLMNGQFCCTGSRVLVQRGIADDLRTRLATALEAVRVGPATDPSAQLGPLIDKAAVARVESLVEEAAAYAKVIVRGGPVTEPALAGGAFFRPALLEVERLDVPLVRQEVFGPVQTFEIFEDEADAVRRANATEFGLAASVYTHDDLRARRVGRDLRFGGIWVNTWGSMSEHFEQGGFKQSGIGVLCGPSAIHEFQNLKTYVTVAPRPS
ncbi:aldehyde dehydrogenase family protein [Streptomyces griseoviridis]|uniref:Aldehyde dehydrogenase n=1 Tax=Streptomyces griseoviridis TaxID=45398 RepID=A0A3Q9KYF2_STRGD|nr:aldehyde dehydrogenase family protein [Streptomyces griseoviridis]AZS88790.1 aldehyde dehydrogenase family protein [Streptomyces griseoviridis]QCN84369.1 aldehyde dehydrogenase [Streptomyces griseoviridis]